MRKVVAASPTEPVESATPAVEVDPDAGQPMTADDPLSRLVGSVTDASPTDSSKKYGYLAEAVAPTVPCD